MRRRSRSPHLKYLKRFLYLLAGALVLAWLGLAAWAYWPSEKPTVPARALADDADRFVTVEGLELRYRTWGEPAPDRPTLLLIHGFANSLQSFRLLAPRLADDYYVVAYDMPGFGLSAKPAPFDYGNANQARIAGELIRALGLRDVVVGGHSLGGAIALRVAVSEPGIRGLVLMNPGIITTGVPAIAKYLVFPFPRLQARLFGDPAFRGDFLRRSFVDPSIVTDEVIADLGRAARTDDYARGMTHMMGQYQDADEAALMPAVQVPTLILWGAQDRKPAGEFEALRDGIPGSVGVRIDDAGHYVHEEAPEECAAALIGLTERL